MSMKTTHRCPQCEHDEVVHVPVVRDSGYNRLMVDHRMGFLGDEEYGEFEAYFCRSCGFSELYVKGARTIRLEKVDGATLLRAERKQAYR